MNLAAEGQRIGTGFRVTRPSLVTTLKRTARHWYLARRTASFWRSLETKPSKVSPSLRSPVAWRAATYSSNRRLR